MGKYIADADVVPAGRYAVVRSNRVALAPLAESSSAADYAALGALLGLKGFAFALFDSTDGPARWDPDLEGEDWQRVQAVFGQPGFVQALKDAGFSVLGYSIVGPYGRTSISNEVHLVKWVQDQHTLAGPVLNVTGWVHEMLDEAAWNTGVDRGKFPQGGSTTCVPNCLGVYSYTLAKWTEYATRAYFPVFLRMPRLQRGGGVYNRMWDDRSLTRVFPMPTLGNDQMTTADYLASYQSYQTGSAVQTNPRCEFALDLRDGADPTEAYNVLQAMGANNGPNGPFIGEGITLSNGRTPTVGLVLLDDLETLATQGGWSLLATARPGIWWDFDQAGEGTTTGRPFGVYSPEVVDANTGVPFDQVPVAVVGQPLAWDIRFHSMKMSFGPGVLFNAYHGAPGLESAFDWLLVNGNPNGEFNNGVSFEDTHRLRGTPPDTHLTLFEFRAEANAFGHGRTATFYLPITVASPTAGAPNAGRVAGFTVNQNQPVPTAHDRSPNPPLVWGAGDNSFNSVSNWEPPWAVAPGPDEGGVTPGPGGPGEGLYGIGPTTCFSTGAGCAGSFCVDNDLLNFVYNYISAYPEFQADDSDLLDFWALLIAMIFHESGWVNDNPSFDCSNGLLQARTKDDPGCVVAEDPPIGGLGNGYTLAQLADPGTQLDVCSDALRSGIIYVRSQPGTWGNVDNIAANVFGFNQWSVCGLPGSARAGANSCLPTYLCIRNAVKAATWPLPASSGPGGAVFCPTTAGITCGYGNVPGAGCYCGSGCRHIGVDFSCTGGGNFVIDQVTPDPTTWVGVSGAAACGQIVSPVKGNVVFAGLDPRSDFSNPAASGFGQAGPTGSGNGYGYYIEVEEETQLRKFRLAHFNQASDLLVSVGQAVEMGTPLAKGMGARGNTDDGTGNPGTHLHFEMYTRSSLSESYALANPETVLPAGCG